MARKTTPPGPDPSPSPREGAPPWAGLPGRYPTYETLRRLVEARRGARTHGELAAAAGLPKQWLSKLLTGRIVDPRVSTVERLLAALGATWADFDRAGQRHD